jgi:hypothetical protein
MGISLGVALKEFISREKVKSYEEALEEIKAAVETANICPGHSWNIQRRPRHVKSPRSLSSPL